MKILLAFLYILIFQTRFIKCYTVEALRCEICKAVVTEMENLISEMSSTVKAGVGSHRLDVKGNPMTKSIPKVHSEVFLLEALEKACGRMEEYARGYDKKTRELRVVKMKMGDSLNPEMSEIYPISDADLNESLKYHCEDMTDEYENNFLNISKLKGPNTVEELCSNETKLCLKKSNHKSEL